MEREDNLNALATRFGILPGYRGFKGEQIKTSRETQIALLRANGLVLDNDVMIGEVLGELTAGDKYRSLATQIIVESGKPTEIPFGSPKHWRISLEGNDEIFSEGTGGDTIILPPLPSGIHSIGTLIDGREQNAILIAAPLHAPSIENYGCGPKAWGLNAALYGLRSARNNGLGDYGDLARMCEISAGAGADFLGVNPLHAIGYQDKDTISPYSPSHRGFLNIEHIATDSIGALENLPDAKAILSHSRLQLDALRESELVDYQGHRHYHHGKLEALFRIFVEQAGPAALGIFDEFCRNRGEYLEKFALFEAISEEHGADWRQWPRNLQRQDQVAISKIRKQLSNRISFHSWLQWVADTQIAAAQDNAKSNGMGLGLYLDLAVGARRGAAESWCENSSVARGVSLGAPPDLLNPNGQNWDITAYAPRKLAESKYRALRRTYGQAMRHCAILRIDHALGLNRSFWIPDDGSAGGYIRQPFEAMLAIIAMEALAADCIIIGEDLGLVPEGFRKTMSEKAIYGYSVLQYEKNHAGQFTQPADLRANTLACFGTHDTPTLKGYWRGEDIDLWKSAGIIDAQTGISAHRQRALDLRKLMAIGPHKKSVAKNGVIDIDGLYNTVHNALAGSAAAMVSVQLDDVLGQSEAQNYPGTVDEYPNWRRKCPQLLDEIGKNDALDKMGRCMKENDRVRGQRPRGRTKSDDK